VLTKLDGDARGGAALAVKAVTGVPIKFLGTGETLDRLEAFRPEGLASRILGMGDIVGLVQDFEAAVDGKQAEEKMGPLSDVLGKLPMFGSLAEQVDERELTKVEAMIHSMTPGERVRPEVIDKSRAARIARGSGHKSKEVTDLIARFSQMREMMGSLGRGGLLSKIPGMGRLAGSGAAGTGDLDPNALLAAGAGNRRMRRTTQAKRRSQQKRKRKQARKSRRKGRKK
jgi:signal recognition particle subunit SRP54